MKILLLCKKYPWPLKDGEVIAIHHMIRGFSKLGHQVTVLAFNTSKHYTNTNTLPEEEKARAEYIEVPIDTSLNVKDALINLFESIPFHVKRFQLNRYSQQLEVLLRQETFDIVQIEGVHLAPYVKVVRQFSDAKVILRAHNIESMIWERLAKEDKNPLKRWYLGLQAKRLAKFEREAINTFDGIVPISEIDNHILSAWGLSVPLYTCPTGIDLDRYEPYLKSTVNLDTIGFIGSLDWIPNQNGIQWFVQKCWPAIVVANPEARLIIAGRNMPDWMRSFGDVKGVTVAGEVDDALKFMMQCGVIIAPLFSGSGMRIKIIEAMALGKPVVTTTVGLEGINAREGEDCMVADSVEQYINAVLEMLNFFDERAEISKNARLFIENKYNNNKFVAGLAQFYQSQFKL